MKCKYGKIKSITEHLIIIVITFVQLGLLGSLVFNIEFLNPVSNAIKNFSITDLFFEVEHNGSHPEINQMITLVDISDVTEREKIADIIDEINICNPWVLGVDVIFEGVKFDSLGNERLTESVKIIKEKSIFANKLTNYSSANMGFTDNVQSFFADELSIKEGYVNLTDNLQGTCIRDFIITSSFKGEKKLSFPTRIMLEVDNNLNIETDDPILINYCNVKFPIVKSNEIIENADLIENRIIIVGSLDDESDMHNTPLGKMAGIEIQAYTLLTLLEHQNARYIPMWLNLIISLLVCGLFEFILHKIYNGLNRNQDNMIMVFFAKANITTMLLLFSFLLCLYWVLYYLFVMHDIIINATLLLSSVTLVCESRNFYFAIKSAYCIRKQCEVNGCNELGNEE